MRDRLGKTTAPARLLPLVPVLLAAAACGGSDSEPVRNDAAPLALETAVAQTTEVARHDEVSGSVEPWVRVAPGTKLLGRVQRVAVREGERVRPGQLLASLERRDLQAAVDQAAAAVAMAQAQLDNAEAQHRRMEQLHARGSVTAKNLEDALAGFRVAQAALEQAQANRARAEVDLGYAEIHAPRGGWVVSKSVEAGDMVAPGQPMFVIEDLSRVRVVLQVPESVLRGLAPGDPVQVRVDALGRGWTTPVARIVPAGHGASRTFDVKLELDNPDGALRSGMFARARLPRGTRQAVRIPRTSIVRRGQLSGIFVVDDQGRARLRWIRLGDELSGGAEQVEPLSGLVAGERYVVAPPPGLTDGTPVAAR